MKKCDRVKELLLDNSALCPNGSDFYGIDYTTNHTKCKCVENKATTEDKGENPIISLTNSIMNSLQKSNWEVIFCYK